VEQHKDAAYSAFELGRYDVAIREFEQAYSIRRDPRLLYNIGLSHLMRFRLGRAHADAVQARDLFKRFLLLAPGGMTADEQQRLRKMRDLAHRYLAELEGPAAPPPSAPPERPATIPAGLPPSAPTPTPPTGGRRLPRAALVLYGVAAAAGVGVAVVGGLALDAQSQARDLHARGDVSANHTMADRADRFALVADVVLAVAVVSAAVGLALHLKGRRAREPVGLTVTRLGVALRL